MATRATTAVAERRSVIFGTLCSGHNACRTRPLDAQNPMTRTLRLTLPVLCACLATACATPATRDATATAGAASAATGAIHVDVPAITHPAGETAAWWYRSGAARAAGNGAMDGRAKNVIVFLGDGMSLTTVAAARIFAGQRAGNPGEEHLLAWERFPATAFA